jgi:transposase
MNVFVTAALADLHQQLRPFYSEIGRPSVDPELMIRMLIVGYCYGIRHERRLCEEVKLHLGYRWFCKLDLNDKVPHHSTFSINRLDRFRESDILRHVFECVVAACMENGLVRGEGFAVDASVMEANASRYHGKAPDELDWTDAQRQKRAVAEYLAALESEARSQGEVDHGNDAGDGSDGGREGRSDRKLPKVISPSDPSSAWTAKANKRVLFGYGLNYLIDVEHAVIVVITPRLALSSPVRGCGKTTLLSMIERLVRRARKTDGITPAATYWLIDREHCTLLVDEADNLGLTLNGTLRAVNSGHRKGGTVTRFIGDRPQAFSTFAPMRLPQSARCRWR